MGDCVRAAIEKRRDGLCTKRGCMAVKWSTLARERRGKYVTGDKGNSTIQMYIRSGDNWAGIQWPMIISPKPGFLGGLARTNGAK